VCRALKLADRTGQRLHCARDLALHARSSLRRVVDEVTVGASGNPPAHEQRSPLRADQKFVMRRSSCKREWLNRAILQLRTISVLRHAFSRRAALVALQETILYSKRPFSSKVHFKCQFSENLLEFFDCPSLLPWPAGHEARGCRGRQLR
jgi:hypothetical protein